MAKKTYKNYIFDLYGTLIEIHTDEDKPSLWKHMSKYLFENFAVVKSADELKADYLKLCKEEEQLLISQTHVRDPEIKIENVWQHIINKRCSDEELQDICYTFREYSRDRFGRYKGVAEMLAKLKKQGKHVYLLSNAQRMFTMKELDIAGLTKYFDDIFISSDYGIKKPNPDFLNMLIEKHGLKKEECVMIGNEAASDGLVAKRVGIDAIIEEHGNYLKMI